VATRLHAFAAAVHNALETAGVTDVEMRVGRKAVAFHGPKRKVAWVCPGGKLTSPKQGGPRLPTGVTDSRTTSCKTNEATVLAYIYGGSDEATEDLFEAVVAAACSVPGAQLEMPDWRWVTQEDEKAGHTDRTELIILTMALRLPVHDEIAPLREILSVDDVCGTLGGTEADWTITPQG
jgi:hypothetical protein